MPIRSSSGCAERTDLGFELQQVAVDAHGPIGIGHRHAHARADDVALGWRGRFRKRRKLQQLDEVPSGSDTMTPRAALFWPNAIGSPPA